MRKNLTALPLVFALFLSAQAEDPPKGKQAIKEAAFQPAADLRHGNLVLVTLNDGTKIRGTLVRVDRKTGKWFVRTSAGERPQAILQKDVKKIERDAKEGGTSTGIRPAGYQETTGQPEIHTMVVYNGSIKTMHYFGVPLSPGERERLKALEDAENEVVRLENQHRQQAQLLQTEVAIQAERQKSHELMNLLLLQQVQSALTFDPSRSHHLFYLKGGQEDLVKLVASPTADGSMAKARENLRAAQTRAVYEDGHVIAVVLED